MTGQTQTKKKVGWSILSLVAIVLTVGMGWTLYQRRQAEKGHGENRTSATDKKPHDHRNAADLLDLPDNTVHATQLKTVAAKIPHFSKILNLRGTLAIDPNRLSHVHARFPGQITKMATVAGFPSPQTDSSAPTKRLLQNFDFVQEGMELAIIQSKDLVEKKSDLSEAIVKLRLEKKTLENYLEMQKSASFPERQVREQRYKVAQVQIDIFTAENTLRAFQVSETEIRQVKKMAENFQLDKEMDPSYVQEWAQVVVTAPISGDIVEKSVIVGDIVDANADLFKIADLSVLAVYLHPYEEELSVLEKLPKPWKVFIKVPAYPEIGELPCEVDRSSPMIDPNEHMALLIGTVKNPNRKLKALQFITASVGIPAEDGVVEIPSNAVIDFGTEAVVFVQQDASKKRFQRRRVKIVQRYFDVVYVKSVLSGEETQLGLQAVEPAEEVVSGGILELEDYLQQLQHEGG